MKAILLTISEISSGNETRTHRLTAVRPDMVMTISPAPTSWAEDKNGQLAAFLDFISAKFVIDYPCVRSYILFIIYGSAILHFFALRSLDPFKPEFTIVIFIHYKPRIVVNEYNLMWFEN